MRLQAVDPAIAHAIAELLLLPPQDRLRQVAIEGRAQDALLHPLRIAAGLVDHLPFRVDAHRHVQELAVQERHPRLHAPGHHRLVGAQAVVVVQRVQLADQFLVELARVRRLVEVQVAAEDLVAALAAQHHLHPHRLDPPRQQEHRRGRADGGDVVGLDVADHFRQRVQAFLEGVFEAMVHGAQRLRGDLRRRQVGRSLQADREAVQARPPGLGPVAILDAMARVTCGDCRHQRGIQPARQQHAVGHVGHQLAMHRGLEGLAQFLQRHIHVFDRVVVAPRSLVVLRQFAGRGVVPVAGRELRHVGAFVHQGLHFRGHPQSTFLVVAPIQRAYAQRIAGDQRAALRGIPQGKGEDAVEPVEETGRAVLAIQRVDHLAVRGGLERIRLRELALQLAMVVDLPVHRQRELPVIGQQRLRTAGRVDDRQALVNEDRAGVEVHAAPVRPAMALALGAVQRLSSQGLDVVAGLQPEDAEDGAHGVVPQVLASEKKPALRSTGSGGCACVAR